MTDHPFWSPRHGLLAVVFALTGLLAWWYLRGLTEETAPPAARPRLPEHVILDFTAVETNASGQPARRLRARELRQYVGEDLAELDQPRLTLFQNDQPPWEVHARRGEVRASGDRIDLRGEVRMERAGDAANRPARLETDALTVWRTRAFAETERPVRIASDADWLTATGMQLWYGTDARATFGGGGRTRLQFAPPETRSGEQAP